MKRAPARGTITGPRFASSVEADPRANFRHQGCPADAYGEDSDGCKKMVQTQPMKTFRTRWAVTSNLHRGVLIACLGLFLASITCDVITFNFIGYISTAQQNFNNLLFQTLYWAGCALLVWHLVLSQRLTKRLANSDNPPPQPTHGWAKGTVWALIGFSALVFAGLIALLTIVH